MIQQAPDPTVLFDLVERCTYRPRWKVSLLEDYDRGQGSRGLTLDIVTRGYNSYRPEEGEAYGVHHLLPVPPAAYDERSWRRWLFEQFLLVERHEAMEFFKIDGVRPYAPHHGPGNDPYIVFDHGTDEDTRTSSSGKVKQGSQESNPDKDPDA